MCRVTLTHLHTVVILVCELDIGSSVIRWRIRSELLVSILMTPVSRLHSHRYWLNWLATSPVIHSLTSVVNYTLTITLLMNTVFHSHSLKPSHHCSCYTIHCGRSIVYHWYIIRSAINNYLTRATEQPVNEWQLRVVINVIRITHFTPSFHRYH